MLLRAILDDTAQDTTIVLLLLPLVLLLPKNYCDVHPTTCQVLKLPMRAPLLLVTVEMELHYCILALVRLLPTIVEQSCFALTLATGKPFYSPGLPQAPLTLNCSLLVVTGASRGSHCPDRSFPLEEDGNTHRGAATCKRACARSLAGPGRVGSSCASSALPGDVRRSSSV